MKKISMSALALVLGLGLAVTQSAFKPADTTKRWGNDVTNHQFVDITNKVEDDSLAPASGTYSCLSSANICSGDDASMPTNQSQLTNTEQGSFRLNP